MNTLKKFHLQDSDVSWHSQTVYGWTKRDALNRYREQWYPNRSRLPRGISIWEDSE